MKGGKEKGVLVAMHEWTAFGHKPFVSGVITAEVISEIFVTERDDGRLLFGQRGSESGTDNGSDNSGRR